MEPKRFVRMCATVWTAVTTIAIAAPAPADVTSSSSIVTLDASGLLQTVNVNGGFDLDNPFFQDLGTNGRRCVSCHQPDNAWTITPANVQRRFAITRGADPIFRNNDGSNCEGATAETRAEQQAAYSLLLTRGLIRVGLDLPPNPEFAIDSVADPNHCGPASKDVSAYRRPLPSTNLRFLTAVMWDGRESSPTTSILQDLAHQANDATRGHAQASLDITADQAQQIVAFETGLFTAQVWDTRAGLLSARGAAGGPTALSAQPFFVGINDPVGLNPTGAPFDKNAFTLFNAWAALGGDPARASSIEMLASRRENAW